MRRPGEALILALAVMVGLTGCAGVPTSGPVSYHSPGAAGLNPGVQLAPLPPAAGASQLLIVEGFLHAMGAYQPNYDVARQYLTADAAQAWRPDSGVQVYADGFPATEDGQTVVLVAPLTGQLDRNGSYRNASGQLRHDFRLIKDPAGQWRIANPPEGLLVSRFLFSTSYQAVNLYFMAANGGVLVPDPRFFPGGEPTLNAALHAQLDGPAAWLSPAVRKADPGEIDLVSARVGTAGTAEVVLSDRAAIMAPEQQQVLLAELAFTATSVPGISDLQVASGGKVLSAASGAARLDRAAFARFAPVSGTPGSLVILREGRFGQVTDVTDWTKTAAVAVPLGAVERFAVRTDVGEIAAITGGGTRLEVAGVGTARPRNLRVGKGLLRPDYSRGGELWSPVSTRIQDLAVFVKGDPVKVRFSGVPNVPVVALRLAPDAVRAALILRVAGQPVVGLVRVQHAGNAINISGWQPIELATTGNTGQPIDLGWTSDTELAVLVARADQASNVLRVGQDGAVATDVGPNEVGSINVLAAAPARPIVGLTPLGAAYRFAGGFNWPIASTDVDALAYSG